MNDNNHGKCKAINHDFTGKLNADGYCEWCETLMNDNEETRSYNEILQVNERLTKANEKLAQSVEVLEAATRNRSRRIEENIMTTDTRLSADEILNELCAEEGGTIGMLPTVENHCDHCPGVDTPVCDTYTKANICPNCGTEGSLFISWEQFSSGDGFIYFRECRVCGDCC